MKTRIENMQSVSSGREVANQFLIYTPEGVYFQSYQSVIAFKPFDTTQKTKLDREKWNYSTTTGKYRNIFLREDIKITRDKIQSGVYDLVDLN